MTAEELAERLRKAAMSYPETREDQPWGHPAFKVKEKTFLFMGEHEGHVNISIKLPDSNETALGLPFVSPTHYGMGKYGWVTVKLEDDREPPLDMLVEWIHESFLAVAPKRVGKSVGEDIPAAVEEALLG